MGRWRRILIVAVLLHLIFVSLALFVPVWGQFEFGSTVGPSTTGDLLIVEDFFSAPGIVQWPVTIMYLDLGKSPGFYDEDDPLYLHVGPGSVRVADVRLTCSPFGPFGSKVGDGDGDLGANLTSFAPPYPRLVFADLGGVVGQYDPNDSVYVKAVPPISQLAAGDVRLTWACDIPPGTMVRGSDPDAGLGARLLHPGPDFALWSPAARGQVRFYNANGDVFEGQLSVPIYDASDRVYFDVSVPSDPPRLFGYVVINRRCGGAIGDLVWKDLNANGIQDDGDESGINGVVIKLCYLYLGEYWEIANTKTINESGEDKPGYYKFEGLCNGTYVVMLDLNTLPEGWRTPTVYKAGEDESLDSNAELAVTSCRLK